MLKSNKSKLIGYKPLLWKKYFDTGYGLTSYLFKVIAVLGIANAVISEAFKSTIIVIVIYSIGCVILGRIWLYSRLLDTEQEIGNMFNPFVDDMRSKFGIPKREKFK